jgi:DNA-binding transcriptional MocR family regulator
MPKPQLPQETVRYTPGVMTAIACGWIADGTVATLEAEKRLDATARQAIATETLKGLRLVRHSSSYLVWLALPEEVRADQVARALLTEGISVCTAEPFVAGKQVPHALRLALGSVGLDTLRGALATVRKVVKLHGY